jgi:hypothetical protein
MFHHVAGEIQRSGLVEVLHEERILAVFMLDLKSRADLVEEASA